MVAIRHPESEVGGQARALNACLTCGSCEVRCPEGVHFTDFVRGLRSLSPAASRQSCPHGELVQSAARLMAEGETKRDLSWVTDDLEVADQGEIALFVGCLTVFDALFEHDPGVRTIDIARSAIRLLNGVGIKPVLLSEERCCGHDLLWRGELETFKALARANTAPSAVGRGAWTIPRQRPTTDLASSISQSFSLIASTPESWSGRQRPLLP
jgi:Fe-S oxidoreductase